MDYALATGSEPFLQTPEADMTFAQLVCCCPRAKLFVQAMMGPDLLFPEPTSTLS